MSGCWELDPVSFDPEPNVLPVHYTPLYGTEFILTFFVLKYKRVPVAQRIEQTRPKGKMEVQFPPGTHDNQR